MFRPHLLDGKRLSDGKLILFKRVASDSQEVHIASYLSSEALRKDPRNHCVPILDVLQDPHEPSISFLVMPFLRYIDQPDFDTVGSILECVQQLLEVWRPFTRLLTFTPLRHTSHAGFVFPPSAQRCPSVSALLPFDHYLLIHVPAIALTRIS